MPRSARSGSARSAVSGGLRVESADYFRGAFDDVPERLNQIVIGPDLSLTFEVWRERHGFDNVILLGRVALGFTD